MRQTRKAEKGINALAIMLGVDASAISFVPPVEVEWHSQSTIKWARPKGMAADEYRRQLFLERLRAKVDDVPRLVAHLEDRLKLPVAQVLLAACESAYERVCVNRGFGEGGYLVTLKDVPSLKPEELKATVKALGSVRVQSFHGSSGNVASGWWRHDGKEATVTLLGILEPTSHTYPQEGDGMGWEDGDARKVRDALYRRIVSGLRQLVMGVSA